MTNAPVEIDRDDARRRRQVGRRANPRDASLRRRPSRRRAPARGRVPSISVKLRETPRRRRGAGGRRLSAHWTRRAPPQRATSTAEERERLGRLRAGIFEDPSSRAPGLNTPHEQKRVSVAAASSGVRRFSLTKSIIFFASEWLIMPCPHIVDSIMTCEFGIFSVLPSKPERIADAVARNACILAALLGAVDRRGDVDAEAEIFLPDALDELLGRVADCRTPQRTS